MTEPANDFELKNEAQDRMLQRLAKIHNFLVMWPGSQNIHATQKEYQAQNNQMTTIEYISDTEDIIKAS